MNHHHQCTTSIVLAGGGDWMTNYTHLKQTFCQCPPDHRPQNGAKEKQGDLGPGDVSVLQKGLFGELHTARATVSPRAQHDAGPSAEELPVPRHGLHFHRPGAPAITAHRGATQKQRRDVSVLKREREKKRRRSSSREIQSSL